MFEINKDIIFVKGFTNGAIYNFNDNKVYSVNKSACNIIERYINNSNIESDINYLNILTRHKLISKSFLPSPYLIKNTNVPNNIIDMPIIKIFLIPVFGKSSCAIVVSFPLLLLLLLFELS